MIRACTFAVVAWVAILSVGISAAHASSPADWLDPDAAVVVRVDMQFLGRASQIAAETGGRFATVAKLAAVMSAAGLGLDVTRTRAWQDSGFDTSRPILLQMGAIDVSEATRVAKALFEAKSWSAKAMRKIPKTYWRSRLVLPIHSARAARSVLSGVRTIPDLHTVEPKNRAEIAMILGARSARARTIIPTLRKRGVFMVGWLPGFDSLVFARIVGNDVVVVDIIGSFGGVPVVWDRESSALLKVVSRGSSQGQGSFLRTVGKGASHQLSRPGLALWLQPSRLLDAARALELTRLLRQDADILAARKRRARRMPAQSPACRDFRELADAGAFTDFAVRLHAGKRRARVTLSWGLRAQYGLRRALTTADDRLPLPRPAANTRLAGSLYLSGLGALRGLARPSAFAGSWERMWERVRQCGGGAATVTAVFGWPQVASLFLDEVASIDPSARRVVASVRNGSVAIHRLAWNPDKIAWAGDVSLVRSGAKDVHGYLDAVFGSSSLHSKPRTHRIWGAGPIRPYAWHRGKKVSVVGMAMGGATVAWRLGHATGKQVVNPQVARYRLDIQRSLKDLGLGSLARALARRYGTSASGGLRFTQSSLVATLSTKSI